MIVFSSLQIRRGVRVLLDNATATINPGQKVGLVGKNGCGKSTLLALLKNELSADAGGFTYPGNWQLAWVNQETPALPQPALEYVIDGDREYRQLEAQLNDANERNDGHAIATVHGKLDASTPGPCAHAPPACCMASASPTNSLSARSATSPVAGVCVSTWPRR